MDIESSPQGWFNALIGVVLGLLGTIAAIYRGKMNHIEEQQLALERRQVNYVTRDELERHIDQLRADRMQQHTENLLRLKTIGEDINRLHDRIDQVLDR
jgi:hypothetical protein